MLTPSNSSASSPPPQEESRAPADLDGTETQFQEVLCLYNVCGGGLLCKHMHTHTSLGFPLLKPSTILSYQTLQQFDMK